MDERIKIHIKNGFTFLKYNFIIWYINFKVQYIKKHNTICDVVLVMESIQWTEYTSMISPEKVK
jgi:hypothetical protein